VSICSTAPRSLRGSRRQFGGNSAAIGRRLGGDGAAMGRYYAFTRRLFSSNNNVRNFKNNFAMNGSKLETKISHDDPDADGVSEEPTV
jgi:hypothetical protein